MSSKINTNGATVSRGGTSASMIYAQVSFGVSRGLSLDRLCEAVGITPAMLVDPEGRLRDEVMSALWRELGDALPDQPLGLQLGARASLGSFGPFLHVARHAPSLGAALQTYLRYAGVTSGGL